MKTNKTRNESSSSSLPTVIRSPPQNARTARERTSEMRDNSEPHESPTWSKFTILFNVFLLFVGLDTYNTHSEFSALHERYSFLEKERDHFQAIANSTSTRSDADIDTATCTSTSDVASEKLLDNYNQMKKKIARSRVEKERLYQRSKTIEEQLEKRNEVLMNMGIKFEEMKDKYEKTDKIISKLETESKEMKEKQKQNEIEHENYVEMKDELEFLYTEYNSVVERTKTLEKRLDKKSAEMKLLEDNDKDRAVEISLLSAEIDKHQLLTEDLNVKLDQMRDQCDEDETQFLYSELDMAQKLSRRLEEDARKAQAEIEELKLPLER